VADSFRWGLKSAADAVGSASDRGALIAYVRELWIESGGSNPNPKPEPWQPGQLANWLTGRKPARLTKPRQFTVGPSVTHQTKPKLT